MTDFSNIGMLAFRHSICGMGLGLIAGIGLFILTFVFHLQPGKPPIDVMLTILP
jgi:Anaerobic C4-dicarboxylate transporter